MKPHIKKTRSICPRSATVPVFLRLSPMEAREWKKALGVARTLYPQLYTKGLVEQIAKAALAYWEKTT